MGRNQYSYPPEYRARMAVFAVVGGIFGNFLREAAVRILDALGAWWGS